MRAARGLYEALDEYGDSDFYPYHMPGHKRSALSGEMAQYYRIDVTEIDGFDDLHHAEGILLEAQRRANALYGADETFYLVNGSTCGVLASIMTAAPRGEELLMARNCHKSVYHAVLMQELQAHYYYPRILPEYGIFGRAEAAEIDDLLERYPSSKAVVITSPTYEGIISDIGEIAEAVHRRGKILIVDEAHGAHLGLDEGMPKGAVAGGADLVIHSLHKTLPAMTQTALLHVQGERVDRRRLRRYLSMLQTSSPSYVMMASMDSCVRYVEAQGRQGFARMRRQYDFFCKKTERCRYLTIGRGPDWDIGKLVIFVRGSVLNGRQLYDILREEYHLQMEMAAGNYVVAIMTLMDSEEGWQRLADAILQIDDRIEQGRSDGSRDICGGTRRPQMRAGLADAVYTAPQTAMTAAKAFAKEQEEVSLAESVGRIAADYIYLYPPGIPLLAPGEVMSRAILEQIRESMEAGLRVQGVFCGEKVPVLVRSI